ncbi:MAG: biotin/lipoyl-containing protein [Bacteroidota bacterium]
MANPLQLSAQVNGRITFSEESLAAGVSDIQPVGENRFRVRVGEQLLEVEVDHFDLRTKKLGCWINGGYFEVSLQTPLLRRIEQLGLAKSKATGGGNITAPMPGLVREVLVKEGEQLEAKQPVLILEAMKMENVIKSDGVGVVQSVKVQSGDAVEKGALLIELKIEHE